MTKKLTTLATGMLLTLSVFYYASCKKSNESITPKKNVPSIDQTESMVIAEMNQYLDGELVDIGELDTSNSQFAIYHYYYDSTSIFTFSSLSAMENWLTGVPFEDTILRLNHLCDSMSGIVNELDTTDQLWDVASRFKPEQGNPKLFKTALGGFKFWDGAPDPNAPPQIPQPGTGASKYFWGKKINFGSWNNRATEIHQYGVGYQVYCTQTKFRGSKFFVLVAGAWGANLTGSRWDNNIMSAW
jgi:hypothetical protein